MPMGATAVTAPKTRHGRIAISDSLERPRIMRRQRARVN